MINKEIFKIADQLQNAMEDQKKKAAKALRDLPEGDTKNSLQSLFKRATSGKVSPIDAQKEIEKIIADAS